MTFHEASKVIKKGDLVRLRNELENGLSPNLSNQYSWTLLMIAAMEGNTSIGRLLIEKGADLDARNNYRGTAVSLAAHTGHPSFVQLLLARGASLECFPFGNNIEVWLDWLGKYSACPPKELRRVRELFDSERKIRAQDQSARSERKPSDLTVWQTPTLAIKPPLKPSILLGMSGAQELLVFSPQIPPAR